MVNYIVNSETVAGSTKVTPVSHGGIHVDEGDKMSRYLELIQYCTLRYGSLKSYNKMDPEADAVIWAGGILDHTGYNTMNREILKRVSDRGMATRIYTDMGAVEVSSDEARMLADLAHTNVPHSYPLVIGSASAPHWEGFLAHYTMCEMVNEMNESFLEVLNRDDEIWVPSEWNKKAFEDSGVRTPIRVMPLGVDEKVYRPVDDRVEFTSGVNKFVFLCVASWNWRKGYDILLEAYMKAFDGNDDVSLVISALTGDCEYHLEVNDIVEKRSKKNPPHVTCCVGNIQDKVMPALYCSADVFALTSRGEGWGLPYCEAAACEIPLIGVNATGQTEFLDPSKSLLITPDKMSSPPDSMLEISDIYEGARFIDFSQTVVDDLVDKMKYAFDNYSKIKQDAIDFRKTLVEKYSWDVSANRVYNRLVELQP